MTTYRGGKSFTNNTFGLKDEFEGLKMSKFEVK